MPNARNDEVEIYYDVHGDPDAPVLMLVPGLGEQIGTVEFPEAQVETFCRAGFRVVPVDCRDTGLSTSFDSAGRPDIDAVLTALMSGEVPSVPYTHFDMADDLIAVADDLDAASYIWSALPPGGSLFGGPPSDIRTRLRR